MVITVNYSSYGGHFLGPVKGLLSYLNSASIIVPVLYFRPVPRVWVGYN